MTALGKLNGQVVTSDGKGACSGANEIWLTE